MKFILPDKVYDLTTEKVQGKNTIVINTKVWQYIWYVRQHSRKTSKQYF